MGIIPSGSVKSMVSRPQKVLSNPMESKNMWASPSLDKFLCTPLYKPSVARKREHIKDLKIPNSCLWRFILIRYTLHLKAYIPIHHYKCFCTSICMFMYLEPKKKPHIYAEMSLIVIIDIAKMYQTMPEKGNQLSMTQYFIASFKQ